MVFENWPGRSKTIGLIPVLAIAVVIGLLAFFNAGGPVYNPPYAAFILTLFFVLAIDIAVAFVSARAYLSSGSLNIVLLGAAVLITGIATMFAIWMLDPNVPPFLTPNQVITLNNISILIGAVLLLLSAITTLTGTGTVELPRRKTMLVITYMVSLVLFVVVSVLTFFNVFPVFLSNSGPTGLDFSVLTATVVLVLASGLCFGLRYMQNRSSILYWYTLALALYGLCLISAEFTVHLGDSLTWATRLALYLSSTYFLLALQSRESKIEVNAGLSERWASAFRNDSEKLASLFANMTNGVLYGKMVTDDSGNPIDLMYLDMNAAYETVLGAKKENFLGKRATEALPNLFDRLPNWIDPYARAVIKGETVYYERPWPYTGKWYYITIYSPEKGYFVAINEDITKRKMAEEALKESEAKYRDLFEKLSDQQSFLNTVLNFSRVGISVLRGEELRFTLLNDTYQAISPGIQILGRRYREVFPEAFSSGAEEKILEVLRTGKTLNIKRYLAPIPGKPDATWEGTVMRLPFKENEEPTVLGLTWDVTDETRSEERFRTLADNVPQLEWMADETGFIFWYNKQWYDYTGTTPEQMEGWGWQSVHDPETLPKVLEKWKASIDSGQPFEMVFPLRGADGVFRPFLTRILPVKDDHGKIVRWFGTNTDITEELEMRRSLERSNAELQQFAYVASHDLQEPLRMVTAYLSLLEKKYGDGLDGDAKKYTDFAIEGGLRARNLVRDLLEVSRLDSQAEPMSRTNMNEVMDNVISNLAVQIGEEHAMVTHDPLPEIVAVKAQMVLLLQNLVSNAIKFHGDQKPEVHVSCENKRNSWLFSVSDNGIGIEPQYKDKIFVIFQRLHSRDEYEGTGIGLAISKKIVERHGGAIWFDSRLGGGTTFNFTIPKGGKT